MVTVEAHVAGAATVPQADPDALYENRADLANARQALAIWESRLAAEPRDYESAWKVARATYWLGTHLPEAERRAALERGVRAGTEASSIEPNRPEGHFWTAASMGALAESFGIRAGLKYRGAIKRELEAVLRIDPGFQKGSADRALGRWYFKVPGLFGGSKKQSELHLRRSLAYDPQSTASLYFLAETLIELDRKDEARGELRKVLAAPLDPEWSPEDREFKAKAKALLEELGN
jgi:hypothetical protein